MNVSDLARRAGVTPKAIRFYESEGILPAARRAPNGYREYDSDDVCRLRLVVALRGLGLPLPESGRLAELCASDNCDAMEQQLLGVIRVQRHDLAARRSELEHLDAELARLESGLAGESAKRALCVSDDLGRKEERQ